MSPLKKLLGQTAVYGLSSIIGRTLNYLLVPLYTHVFSHPSDYGVISQLYAFVAFLMVLLTFGMETSYFRFIQDHEDKQKVFQNSFLTVLALNTVFFISIYFFNQSVADSLLFSEHPEYIVLMSAIVVIDAASALPLAKLRAEDRARRFASIQFISIGVNIILNLILLLGFFDPERPEEGVLFILFANLISSMVKPVLLYKDYINITFSFDVELFKRMLRYSFPILIAGFAGIINETLDRIMLKQMLYDPAAGFTAKMADEQIGIYSACYKLAMLVTILLQAYRYAAEPFFFNQMRSVDRDKVYAKVMNYFVAIVCVVFLGVSLNIDIFKYFIPKKAYWVGLDVVPILLLANVFLGIYFNQSIWYKLSNQTKFGAYISIIGAFFTIVINYFFIPEYGFRASAWATMIVYALQMVISYFLGQKYHPIKYNLRKFFMFLGSALFIYAISTWITPTGYKFLDFVLHNLLILFFIYIVFFVEGISIKRLLKGKLPRFS